MKAKTAIVTGASRGIGNAIARQLAADGYNLILSCKSNKTLLNDFSIELSSTYGVSCQTVIGDISLHETAIKIKDSAHSLGDASILVHNAAISHVGLTTDLEDDKWHEIINTNLSSCFYLIKEISPSMIKNKNGSILFISSVWGENGASCEVAYSASKGGVNAFTKALAKELAPSGISVNALSCGIIDTDMNKCFSKEEIESIAAEIPIGRLGTKKEVGEMALSILKAPKYLTGQIIRLDGSWQ